MANHPIKAIVLAGGLAHWAGLPKALLPVGDETLGQRTARILKAIPSVTSIVVVAEPSVLEGLPEGIMRVPSVGDLWANTLAGIDALSPSPEDDLLLCAADMPFLTVEALQTFLTAAVNTGADLVYLAVPLTALQGFLGTEKVHRTSATLKEGTLTGGNLFLLKAKALPNITALAQQAIRFRKNPLRLGRLAGWHVIARFLLRRLSVRDLERRAEELLGCRCKAVIADLPELAFDVDKPEDYQLAQRLLSGRFEP